MIKKFICVGSNGKRNKIERRQLSTDDQYPIFPYVYKFSVNINYFKDFINQFEINK